MLQASSALLCEDVCDAFGGAPLHDESMTDSEDHALHLLELPEFTLGSDAVSQSDRVAAPVTAADSQTQTHSATAPHPAENLDYNKRQPAAGAHVVQAEAAAHARGSEMAEALKTQQLDGASTGTSIQHAASTNTHAYFCIYCKHTAHPAAMSVVTVGFVVWCRHQGQLHHKLLILTLAHSTF